MSQKTAVRPNNSLSLVEVKLQGSGLTIVMTVSICTRTQAYLRNYTSLHQILVPLFMAVAPSSYDTIRHDTTSGVLLKMEAGIRKGAWRRA